VEKRDHAVFRKVEKVVMMWSITEFVLPPLLDIHESIDFC
jgi:hypothetical protein